MVGLLYQKPEKEFVDVNPGSPSQPNGLPIGIEGILYMDHPKCHSLLFGRLDFQGKDSPKQFFASDK